MTRQLRLWVDDDAVGCGQRILLEVSCGREYAYLLHVPTLARVKLHLSQIKAQMRRGTAEEVPITRGAIGRVLDARAQAKRYGRRYSEAFVRQALGALRA